MKIPDRRSVQRPGHDRRSIPRRFCSIEDDRLFFALQNVACGRGFMGHLTSHEKEVLAGLLVHDWSSSPSLTRLGWKVHAMLREKFCKMVNDHSPSDGTSS
jgi:hypothetical protein